jgi:hypothetical protein
MRDHERDGNYSEDDNGHQKDSFEENLFHTRNSIVQGKKEGSYIPSFHEN